MKFLGQETQVEVKTKSVRKVEYIRCDMCGKKILPCAFAHEKSSYVTVHTWHHDWGNDSIESHEYKEYCKECAKKVIAEYIDDMDGSEELELSHEYLWSEETVYEYDRLDDEYCLVDDDKEV